MRQWKSSKDIFTANGLYSNVEFLLQVFQTAAIMEVVHAAIGLVKSNPVLVFLQVLSRLVVVWLITWNFKEAQNSIGLLICCLCWSLAEIVRYLYYALNILNKVPYFITWCRYSFFIILYPVGISGELIAMYNAYEYLTPLNIRKNYSYFLPNQLNFSFDLKYFIAIGMLLYIPVFPQLYTHMLSQRKKMLGGAPRDKKKE